MNLCIRLYMLLGIISGVVFAAEPPSTWIKTSDCALISVDQSVSRQLTTLVNMTEIGSSSKRNPVVLESIAKADIAPLITLIRYQNANNQQKIQSFLASLPVDQLYGMTNAANFLEAPKDLYIKLRAVAQTLSLAQLAVVYWLTGSNKRRTKDMSVEYAQVFDTLPGQLKELLKRLF